MDDRELEQQLIAWRHAIHCRPECAFEEHATAELAADALEKMGLEVCRGIGGTGVVASLSTGEGDVIGIRADMDAIAMSDRGVHDHTSQIPGRTHACGHDGHTASLLGAALLLSARRDFRGTVRLIFQPAEEPGRGARAMLDDGLLERFPIDEIYGLHNVPFLPAGVIHTRPGGIMASEDNFSIRITGRGSHASSPHTGVDPLAVEAELYLALQTVISRSLDPLHSAVLSCTQVTTDGVRNVLPAHAEILGDVRSFSREDQALIETRMREICEGVCRMNRAEGAVVYTHELAPVINTPRCVRTAVDAACRVAGEDRVDGNCQPWLASEDFSVFLERVPGCFLLLGSGTSADPKANIPLHNAEFDYNDRILLTGAKLWAELVRRRLPR